MSLTSSSSAESCFALSVHRFMNWTLFFAKTKGGSVMLSLTTSSMASSTCTSSPRGCPASCALSTKWLGELGTPIQQSSTMSSSFKFSTPARSLQSSFTTRISPLLRNCREVILEPFGSEATKDSIASICCVGATAATKVPNSATNGRTFVPLGSDPRAMRPAASASGCCICSARVVDRIAPCCRTLCLTHSTMRWQRTCG